MKRALGANYRPAWDNKMWECYAAKKKDAGKELDERGSDIVAAGEQQAIILAVQEESWRCCGKVTVCIWHAQWSDKR